jgi:hypothetical protein
MSFSPPSQHQNTFRHYVNNLKLLSNVRDEVQSRMEKDADNV